MGPGEPPSDNGGTQRSISDGTHSGSTNGPFQHPPRANQGVGISIRTDLD
jgi:hypothetical protein